MNLLLAQIIVVIGFFVAYFFFFWFLPSVCSFELFRESIRNPKYYRSVFITHLAIALITGFVLLFSYACAVVLCAN